MLIEGPSFEQLTCTHYSKRVGGRRKDQIAIHGIRQGCPIKKDLRTLPEDVQEM